MLVAVELSFVILTQ